MGPTGDGSARQGFFAHQLLKRSMAMGNLNWEHAGFPGSGRLLIKRFGSLQQSNPIFQRSNPAEKIYAR
jgi:hypothetical protein